MSGKKAGWKWDLGNDLSPSGCLNNVTDFVPEDEASPHSSKKDKNHFIFTEHMEDMQAEKQ